MAFFPFGKKDKNPTEVPATVAKTPPTPPKLQTPPGAGTPPAVRPPQPTGLMPAAGKPSGVGTTQPMVMLRTGSPPLSQPPPRPGTQPSTRSTQRIVLPSNALTRTTATKSLSLGTGPGRINLPIGMILRWVPPEVLAGDMAEFEASGAAATEIALPMNMILTQLPSGKVEIPLSDLVAHFPAGYLQPTDSIATYLPKLINLPLMDVVMRIPPDLLALRPDQKDVDAAVINMADPFTEEILREQAEAARKQAQPNIIEESQAPQEEFVPQDAARTVIPPRRPPADPLPNRPAVKTALATPPPPIPGTPRNASETASRPSASPGSVALPKPPATRLPTPASISSLRTPMPAPVPPQGAISMPPRSTTVLPNRTQIGSALPTPAPSAPIPPIPRHTASIPAPPAPRHTTALPKIGPASAPIATPSALAATAALVAPASVVPPTPPVAAAPAPILPPPAPVAPEPEPEPAPIAASKPDSVPPASAPPGDDLQRLAALAMQQLGDTDEEDGAKAETHALAEPIRAEPEPEPAVEPEPATTPMEATAPAPVEAEEPPVIEEPAAEPAAVKARAVEPEPEPTPEVAPEPEPAPAPVAEETPAPEEAPAPPAPAPLEPEPTAAEPVPAEPTTAAPMAEEDASDAPVAAASVAFNLNTCTADDLVLHIPGCSKDLAHSIVEHRGRIGSFKRLEDLLDVPGITKAAYTNLTGEAPPDNRIPLSLSELLGFPPEMKVSLKDVTERIACWPDVTGCVLGQSTGLSLVGTVPEGLNKAAIVAFVPRMFDAINKSYEEITGKETDALSIPSAGTSFHIFRNKDLFLIILCRLPQMPDRHLKVARFVLSALSIRTE